MLGHNSYQLSKTNRCFCFSFFALCTFLMHFYQFILIVTTIFFETNKKPTKISIEIDLRHWIKIISQCSQFTKNFNFFFFHIFIFQLILNDILYVIYFILHLIATFSIHTNTVHQINLSNQIKWSIQLLEKLVKKKIAQICLNGINE